MKILAFADPHASLPALKEVEKKAKDADVILCAGDISIFEQYLEKFLEIINKMKKPVLIIHGNHESPELTEALCAGLKNLIFAHKKIHRIKNYVFASFGGGGFDRHDEEFEKFAKKIKIKPDEKLILMTHAPPYGTKLDIIGKSHYGCQTYTNFIKVLKPALYICGHFHETFGETDKIGKTILSNPGPNGMVFDV